MIRVKWRKNGEWFGGFTAANCVVWTKVRDAGMKFKSPKHFRRLMNLVGDHDGGRKFRWSSLEDIAFVKVKP